MQDQLSSSTVRLRKLYRQEVVHATVAVGDHSVKWVVPNDLAAIGVEVDEARAQHALYQLPESKVASVGERRLPIVTHRLGVEELTHRLRAQEWFQLFGAEVALCEVKQPDREILSPIHTKDVQVALLQKRLLRVRVRVRIRVRVRG